MRKYRTNLGLSKKNLLTSTVIYLYDQVQRKILRKSVL